MSDLGPLAIRSARIKGDEEIKKLKERKTDFSADRTVRLNRLIGILVLVILLVIAWLML